MIVVCADSDGYFDLLDQELRRRGGRAIRATFDNVMSLVVETHCDFVIFDPEDHPAILLPGMVPGSSGQVFVPPRPDPYLTLRQLTESDWARDHNTVVFTNISKSRFDRQAKKSEINPRRIDFYSKDDLEIPPALESVREMVLDNPARYIGYDHERHLPDAITVEWIAGQRELYAYLEPYLLRRLERAVSLESLFAHLPVGFRYLYRVCYMASEVNNGGFLQFLCNARSGDREGQAIVDTVAALRRTGSPLAGLLERAIRINAADLPEAVLAAVGPSPRKPPARSEEQVEKMRDDADQEFNDLDGGWIKEFDAYVRKHPDEFVHPGD